MVIKIRLPVGREFPDRILGVSAQPDPGWLERDRIGYSRQAVWQSDRNK